MANNLLYVPFRRTKETSIGEKLKVVIARDYFQTPSLFDSDLSQLTKIGKKVFQIKDEQADKATEIILQQYYIQIVNLTKKFPDDVMEFLWYGTLGYKPSGPYKLRSLKFEQYNIIYQMGSLYSQLACRESRFTDEGLKRSCNYFQTAAGCFDFLVETMEQDKFSSFHVANDFSQDTLKHLKYLMLSQAQESIWQKALSAEMKNSVLAKLSQETANMYNKSLEYANKSDFIKLEFVNYCAVKHYHFSAAAHYRKSLLEMEESKHGEQVAHLRRALELSNKGLTYKRYVLDLVIEDLVGLQKMVDDSLRIAEKDNDLIYLKPVPDPSDIQESVTPMVKPIIINALADPLSSDRLFLKELLPYLIIQISLAYRDRQDNFILKNVLEPLQALNKMMNHFLTERQLPASIDSIQKPENIPESIVQHSQDIINNGGTQLIESLYDDILQLSSECRDIYEGCQQRLVIEQEEDEIFRETFGTHWTRVTSEVAAKELWVKINGMEEYLTQADKADDIILTCYHEIKEYLELYCGGYESLIKFIPSSLYVSLSGEILTIVNDIREALNDTVEMESTRREFLKKLENKSKDNNILPKLIGDYKERSKIKGFVDEVNETSFELVYHQHMKMFNEDIDFVDLLKNKQIVLEQRIDQLNQRFIELYGNSDDTQPNNERKDSLQTLEDIYSRYLQLISNINEARKFYLDFKNRGSAVLEECDQYVNKRRTEARDFQEGGSGSQITHQVIPKTITPIPVVASPVPKTAGSLTEARTDNATPLTQDIEKLQEQFNHTTIKRR